MAGFPKTPSHLSPFKINNRECSLFSFLINRYPLVSNSEQNKDAFDNWSFNDFSLTVFCRHRDF